MVATPDPAAVTVPPATVATLVAPLLHVPPGVASESTVVPPTHRLIAEGGVIAEGLVLTVTGAVTKQDPIV